MAASRPFQFLVLPATVDRVLGFPNGEWMAEGSDTCVCGSVCAVACVWFCLCNIYVRVDEVVVVVCVRARAWWC